MNLFDKFWTIRFTRLKKHKLSQKIKIELTKKFN
jgi:hypothetical protein